MPAKQSQQIVGRSIRIESSLEQSSLRVGKLDDVALAAADGQQQFPPIEIRAYDGGPFRQYWSADPLVIDLEGFVPSQRHPLLLSHIKDVQSVLGHANATEVKNGYVWVSGVASGAGAEDTDRAIELMRRGVPFQASLGATIDRYEMVKAGEKVTVNGKTIAGPVMVVRASTHRETSLVLLGAASDTETKIAATAAEDATMPGKPDDINATDGNGPSATAAPAATATPAPPIAAAAPAGDPLQAIRQQQAAEVRRVAAIQAAAAKFQSPQAFEIVASAIEDGRTAELAARDLELAHLRSGRGTPGGPAVHVSRREHSPQVSEAALCLAMGFSGDKLLKGGTFDSKTIDAASVEMKNGGGSINQLVLEAAAEKGCHERRITAGNAVRVIEAALTSHTLTNLLGNVANKLVADSFATEDQAWMQFCGVQNLNNFQTHTICRLVGGMEYQQVGPGGEVQHATIGEGTSTLKASTKAILVVLSNEDIVNDDTGKLQQFLMKLGSGAAISLNRAVYTALIGNAGSFFAAGNGNYISGASTALGVDALQLAVTKLREMKDEKGNFITPQGRILLVNPALEMVANQLYKSQFTEGSTAKSPNLNIWAGAFPPVVTPWIGAAATDAAGAALGGTANLWYLLGKNGNTGVVNVGFINGQQAPRVDQVTLPADRMGIGFLGSHAFGVALGEKKLGVMSKGSA